MPKTFKNQVDEYFTIKYHQLESTTTKIIKKYNRTLEPSNVLSFTYLYILDKEKEILQFAGLYSKSIEHTIYAFTLRHLNCSIIWSGSTVNKDALKFMANCIQIDDDNNLEVIEYEKTTHYQHNIYNEEFIELFYKSLNKEDSICFNAYYYEGIDNAKDLSLRFDISPSSAYAIINKLKRLMKNYIQKHKVE